MADRRCVVLILLGIWAAAPSRGDAQRRAAPCNPPDSIPAIADDLHQFVLIDSTSAKSSVHRTVIVIEFDDTTSCRRRRAIIASVRGRVIGGEPLLPGGNGPYYVRIPDDPTGTRNLALGARLARMRGVAGAHALSLMSAKSVLKDPAAIGPRVPGSPICVRDETETRIVLTPLDLGLERIPPMSLLRGPRLDALATDSTSWSRLWRLVADTGSAPSVDFSRFAVIVVASRPYGSRPYALEIERIVSCDRSNDLVVVTRVHSGMMRHDPPTRSIRAVLVPAGQPDGVTVRFVELPPVADRPGARRP